MTAREAERRLRRGGWTKVGVIRGEQLAVWSDGVPEVRIPLTPTREVCSAALRLIKLIARERSQ